MEYIFISIVFRNKQNDFWSKIKRNFKIYFKKMNLNGKRVLLTGADGFIGSHLLEALLNEGCKLRAFVSIILLIPGVGLIH